METQNTQNAQETQDTDSEQEFYLQKDVNYGQTRINFELNEIDKDVVETLKAMVQILKKLKTLPSLTHDLNQIDFSKIDAAISDADQRSQKVADIRPPGCEGPYPN